MKLYHGSPKKLKFLNPRQGKVLSEFENQKAVFLCKTFKHAALYAIGKTLKGKTVFAVTPNRLLIVGNKKPGKGYVYEVNVKANKGPRQQYSYKKQIRKFKIYKVDPKNYKKYIRYIANKKELLKILKITT
ncbi:MAG: hypothetical protein QXK80_00160 [Candidatus Pacearchaeota archaeon]